MEERRKSGSKESKIKVSGSLHGFDCCIKKLYAIFVGLVVENRFKIGVLDDSKRVYTELKLTLS